MPQPKFLLLLSFLLILGGGAWKEAFSLPLLLLYLFLYIFRAYTIYTIIYTLRTEQAHVAHRFKAQPWAPKTNLNEWAHFWSIFALLAPFYAASAQFLMVRRGRGHAPWRDDGGAQKWLVIKNEFKRQKKYCRLSCGRRKKSRSDSANWPFGLLV